jgi:hypothetical protein
LYSQPIRAQREVWFKEVLQSKNQLTEKDLLNFHLSKHDNGSVNDLIMERDNELQTISVSQVVDSKEGKRFYYIDLITDQEHNILINEKQFS